MSLLKAPCTLPKTISARPINNFVSRVTAWNDVDQASFVAHTRWHVLRANKNSSRFMLRALFVERSSSRDREALIVNVLCRKRGMNKELSFNSKNLGALFSSFPGICGHLPENNNVVLPLRSSRH